MLHPSNVDRLFEYFCKLFKQLSAIGYQQAVVDISEKQIEHAHQLVVNSIRDIFLLHNLEISRRYSRFYESWKELKLVLSEGVKLDQIRSHSQVCHLTLFSLYELYKEVCQKKTEELKTQFWSGDALVVTIKAAIERMPQNKGAGIKSLYLTLKRCLAFEPEDWRMRFVEIFFRVLSKYNYKLAVDFLEIFSFQERELKDVAILCLLASAKADNVEMRIPLLAGFSSDERRSQGLRILFSSCHETHPELAYRLIKKMANRTDRNESLCELSLSRAKAGDIRMAKEYCEQITSQVLRQRQEKILKSFEVDDRPVFTGIELIKFSKLKNANN